MLEKIQECLVWRGGLRLTLRREEFTKKLCLLRAPATAEIQQHWIQILNPYPDRIPTRVIIGRKLLGRHKTAIEKILWQPAAFSAARAFSNPSMSRRR